MTVHTMTYQRKKTFCLQGVSIKPFNTSNIGRELVSYYDASEGTEIVQKARNKGRFTFNTENTFSLPRGQHIIHTLLCPGSHQRTLHD